MLTIEQCNGNKLLLTVYQTTTMSVDYATGFETFGRLSLVLLEFGGSLRNSLRSSLFGVLQTMETVEFSRCGRQFGGLSERILDHALGTKTMVKILAKISTVLIQLVRFLSKARWSAHEQPLKAVNPPRFVETNPRRSSLHPAGLAIRSNGEKVGT